MTQWGDLTPTLEQGVTVVSRKEELAEDVLFILEECARLDLVAKGGIRNLPKEDIWFSLPHPSGSGEMICGRKAHERLRKLADLAASRAGLRRRIELDTIRRPLAKLIVERFMTERRPIDVQQVERVLSQAGKQAASKCVAQTHYAPCHLMTARDPEQIALGPIVFHRQPAFRRLVRPLLRDYGNQFSPERAAFARELMAEALAFYRNFGWVAVVTIPNCDAATSNILQERAVLSALDCLQLTLRARNTDKMRTGGPGVKIDRRASLHREGDGPLWATHSHGSVGQVGFLDGWSEALKNEEISVCLALCGVALEVTVDPNLVRPLSRRFLDAAQWFGEALRDNRPATQVVKYVTALECLLMTEERDDITALVAERLAAMCFDPNVPGDRERWRGRARRAYALRSALVHGSTSPHDEDVAGAVPEIADLCEFALVRALSAFGNRGLLAPRLSKTRLAAWFQEIIEWADKAEGLAAVTPTS